MALSWTKQLWSSIFLIVYLACYAHGLQCYKCNSTNTPDCAINPSDKLEKAACPQDETECAMAIMDDMATYRGCASEILYPEDCEFCLNSTCTGDLCNVIVYPKDRLFCHKCEKGACLTVSGGGLPCLNYAESDMCYVDVIDETDAVRGCTSDNDYSAGMYSYYCKANGCNNDTAVSPFTCLKCDSEIDENCKHGPNGTSVSPGSCKVKQISDVCTVDVLLGRSENCYTYHEAEHVMRGCSRLDPDVVSKMQFISICRKSNCNDDCVMAQKCKVCDSDTDPNCMDNVSKIDVQDCPDDTSSCFTCKQGDYRITRGCGNVTENDQCLSCWDDPGCNDGQIRVCYQCNSANTKECARWGHAENVDLVICPGQCVAKVTDDDYTVRGCQTGSLKCAPGDDLCNMCDDDTCNGGVFPTNRLLCYQCDETDSTCNYAQLFVRPTACYSYDPDDQCYQFLNDQGKMIRGCKSDLRYLECRKQKKGSCFVCDESGCNSQLAVKQPNISCISCDVDDVGCAWAQLTSKQCTAPIPISDEGACYTYQHKNQLVDRGCMGDEGQCDISDKNCEVCNQTGCNNENKVYQRCVRCTGKDGEGPCAEDATSIAAVQCPNSFQFYDHRGCYVRREEDVVTRGCINELSDALLKQCYKDDLCKTCLDQSCNYQKVNSAVYLSAVSPSLLLLISYTVNKVYA